MNRTLTENKMTYIAPVNQETNHWIIELLREEVKPAAGCTEPVAVALAAAKVSEVLNNSMSELVIGVSPNIYKNGFAVMLPGVMEAGLDLAAALGSARASAVRGLDVLNHLSEEEIRIARQRLAEGKIRIELIDTEEKVMIQAEQWSEDRAHHARVIISGRHDRIVEVFRDGVCLEKMEEKNSVTEKSNAGFNRFYSMKLKDLVTVIDEIDPEPLAFLLDGIAMNQTMAEVGMASPVGLGTAFALKQRYSKNGQMKDLARLAMTMTAGASDARMAGVDLPVMSSNGSGNNGITAIMPLVAYFELKGTDRADQIRALALSHLINSYIKAEIGRLSALCSCGIAAATGASAAIAWLDTRDPEIVESTMTNMMANLSGMVCDGAKLGCALKLATAASTAVETAALAVDGIRVPAGNGLVGRTIEETISNLGRLSRQGMQLADAVVLDIQETFARG
ncbi:serine dehydratase subunit alpha family protein [Acidaminobacter sp.]|uniref:L-cysteine desulfidase family protein n=1 Tax=Acidaminobacter sp. TaxID=1872102 RepID=UPI002568DD2E|nr:L-serine ammonia-lyase, iron-sulfur-dependent, subunit alpha [Acidaminobacter sp.]MDK9710530.1 L-serine ammonia-lyase, iron-sulfur-dependent, subunit alpha [Acidaminobacter sp.]